VTSAHLFTENTFGKQRQYEETEQNGNKRPRGLSVYKFGIHSSDVSTPVHSKHIW
jgi:hypothetical protein